MRAKLVVATVTVVGLTAGGLSAATASTTGSTTDDRPSVGYEKHVVDGELVAPSSPNPLVSFLPDASAAQTQRWRDFGQTASQVTDDDLASGLGTPILVAEQEPGDTSGVNDTLETAQALPTGFGPASTAGRPALISGSAPTIESDEIAFDLAELNGSFGTAVEVDLTIGDNATSSGEIGDEEAPDGPPDFDFVKLPDLPAGASLVVDIDTPEPFGDLDPFVAVWNPDLSDVEIAANDDDGESFDSLLVFTIPAGGDYYVSIGGFGAFVPEDPTDPASPSVTGEVGSEGVYDVTIALESTELDFYSFQAEPGDILGASVDANSRGLALFGPDGSLLVGSAFDLSFIHPPASPLPGGGVVSLAYVLDEPGTYYLAVVATSDYVVDLQAFRPAKELERRATAALYLDFDGGTVDPGIFFGAVIGEVELSPLSAFLERWGLEASDEDAVIDAVVASVKESLEHDLEERGANGSREHGDGPGSFDLVVLNSRDHRDLWGRPDVSRIIVGGTIDELLIETIGIAQSIDVGDFESEETAVVLLDVLSASPGDPLFFEGVSLNDYEIAPPATMVDLVGTAVGNITAHEAGHFFANWHTDQFNDDANIMDQGGNLPGTIGVGPDGVFGTTDDVDVDFGPDTYVPNEGFIGTEDTLNSIAFGLSTGDRQRYRRLDD